MANLYVRAVPPTDLNRNTEWFTYPGVWTTYILILFFAWLVVLSVFGCSPGMAWTTVNLVHAMLTYQFFHWKKGTPFADDQGIYNRLTWWEQVRRMATYILILFFAWLVVLSVFGCSPGMAWTTVNLVHAMAIYSELAGLDSLENELDRNYEEVIL
ncbi:ORM1-like protein 3 [Tanacetum coccineum]